MKNIVLKIVFLIALCVFLYSGFNLGYTYYKYWKVDHDNDVLVKEVVKTDSTVAELSLIDPKDHPSKENDKKINEFIIDKAQFHLLISPFLNLFLSLLQKNNI